MIGATDRGLCFLQLGDTRGGLLAMLEKEYPAAHLEAMSKPYHPDFQKWMEALNGYLAGTEPHFDLPLDIRATVFQIRVWNDLQTIRMVKRSRTGKWPPASATQVRRV